MKKRAGDGDRTRDVQLGKLAIEIESVREKTVHVGISVVAMII